MQLRQTALPAAGRARDEQMRHLAEVAEDRAAGDVFAERHVQRRNRAALRQRLPGSREIATIETVAFGISIPTADLPGIGASMRTEVAASASARSSASDADARDLHAAFGLELVARDRRSALDVHDLRADAEATRACLRACARGSTRRPSAPAADRRARDPAGDMHGARPAVRTLRSARRRGLRVRPRPLLPRRRRLRSRLHPLHRSRPRRRRRHPSSSSSSPSKSPSSSGSTRDCGAGATGGAGDASAAS